MYNNAQVILLLIVQVQQHRDLGSVSHQTQLCDSQVFAGFLGCDNRTKTKSFLKKIAREFARKLHKNRTKFPENSRAIFWRNDFIIVRLPHLRNPVKSLRIAELRLIRNPPLYICHFDHTFDLLALQFYTEYCVITY